MLSKPFHKESPAPFCNRTWRHFVKNICKKIDRNNLSLQVISPFGFELLEDKKFLYKSIRRLYCYIGIPSQNAFSCDLFEISKTFSDCLLSSIHEIGINLSDVAILALQDKIILCHENNYQCSHSDKLIDIQTKIISNDILHDYANYIICTIDSISSKKEEPAHFIESKRHRCRTYQLYVMLEKIFGYLLPSMTIFQAENFCTLFKLIDNSIQMFYSPSELFVTASNHELHLLHSLINPRVELMYQVIQDKSSPHELIKLKCDAYHVAGKLELKINKKIYEKAVHKIMTTYLSYVYGDNQNSIYRGSV